MKKLLYLFAFVFLLGCGESSTSNNDIKDTPDAILGNWLITFEGESEVTWDIDITKNNVTLYDLPLRQYYFEYIEFDCQPSLHYNCVTTRSFWVYTLSFKIKGKLMNGNIKVYTIEEGEEGRDSTVRDFTGVLF